MAMGRAARSLYPASNGTLAPCSPWSTPPIGGVDHGLHGAKVPFEAGYKDLAALPIAIGVLSHRFCGPDQVVGAIDVVEPAGRSNADGCDCLIVAISVVVDLPQR